MKISIITCCKNSLPYLKETINSVTKQNYQNFEHIFVISQSEDDTFSYVKNLDYKKKKIFFRNKKSLYNCLNFGIKKAKGEIIFILHSDDLLINNYVFSKVIKSIKKVDFLFSNILITDRENTKNIFRKWESSRTKKNWSPTNLPAHTSLFIKKKIINKIGLYNEKFKISSDFDYFMRKKEEFKNLEIVNNGYAEFDTNGFSSAPSMRIKIVLEESRILFKYTGNIFYLFLHFFYGLISVLRLNFIR